MLKSFKFFACILSGFFLLYAMPLCSHKAQSDVSEVVTKWPKKSSPVAIKDYTVIVYAAADNDLNWFAHKNIQDMKQVGSTAFVNILVQLDGYGPHEKTKRFYIEKNAAIQVNSNDIASHQKLNSGNEKTLINCFKWAAENYPAHHYVLVLWNHGSGVYDNIRGKAINSSELFFFNPATHMLELNRSMGFFDFVQEKYGKTLPRGICFSDTYGTYLTNEKLDFALKEISQKILNGNAIDLVLFDACLMSMIEIAGILKPYVNFMVGSEEVVLGTGYPYAALFEPFKYDTMTPHEFALHVVKSYKEHYKIITNDFTQSAINLNKLYELEKQIREVNLILLECLATQKNNSVKRALKTSRSRRLCTYFSEPSYIDLHHFYTNIIQTIEFMSMTEQENALKQKLGIALEKTLELIDEVVISHESGQSLPHAHGLSICFPTRYIDISYTRVHFAQNTLWLDVLDALL